MMFLIVMIIFSIFMLWKIENAFKNQNKILNAINAYGDDTREYGKAISMLQSMESYFKTMWRLWDFGYENILPKEYFELIKPYIKEK